MRNVKIRWETERDREAIGQVVAAAFEHHPHSRQTEHLLVAALRNAGELALSLVAEAEGEILGYIAFSRVMVDGQACAWFGLGPVAVAPAYQRQGIGSHLIRAGLDELRQQGAGGCVLLGNPEYYRRFGFNAYAGLTLAGVPAEHFLALAFTPEVPQGQVTYTRAFEVC